MRKMPWAMYLWPGLPQIWLVGSWTGLIVAMVFAAICNLLLLGSFAWCELIAQNVRTSVWAVCGIVWGIGVGWSAWRCRQLHAVEDRETDNDHFGEAVNHYLKGDYFQAEHLLETLLRTNARDLDARLMLATLLRHSGRLDEASRHLNTLIRFDGAAKWELEIEHERELLAEAKDRKTTGMEAAMSKDVASKDAVADDAVSGSVVFDNNVQPSICKGLNSVTRAA
jgi:hypothetical protein